MKNFARILMISSCFFYLIASQAQVKDNKNDVIMNSKISHTGLVCRLEGAEFQERLKALEKEIVSKITNKEETESGVRLYFDDKNNADQTLMDFVLSEKRCCPFFRFDLTLLPDSEGLILEVSGEDGAKEMIKQFLGG